jgi:nucleotide-binding universal stress UspA family protein
MKLLVAIDFSASTTPLLEMTKRLAQAPGASVLLVHVAAPEPDFVGYDVGPDVVRSQVAGELREEHRRLQKEADRLRENGVDASALLLRGAPVESLLAMAEKQAPDLIVVGSHGKGMMKELLLGSVSKGLIRHGRWPVTVVPGADA